MITALPSDQPQMDKPAPTTPSNTSNPFAALFALPQTIESVSELLQLIESRDPKQLSDGLLSMNKQLEQHGSLEPLLVYAKNTKGKLPELFKCWHDSQHDVNMMHIPHLIHFTELSLKCLAKADPILASILGVSLSEELLASTFYRFLSSSNQLVTYRMLCLLTAIGEAGGKRSADALAKQFDFGFAALTAFARNRRAVADVNTLEQGPTSIRNAFASFCLSILGCPSVDLRVQLAGRISPLLVIMIGQMGEDPLERVDSFFSLLRLHVLGCRVRNLALRLFTGPLLDALLKLRALGQPKLFDIVNQFLCELMCKAMVQPIQTLHVTLPQKGETLAIISCKNRQVLEFACHLKPFDRVEDQHLLVEILAACPDAVPSYLISQGKTFQFGDDAAGARWIALMSFAIQVANLPVLPLDIEVNGPHGLLTATGLSSLIPPRHIVTRILNFIASKECTEENTLATQLVFTLLEALFKRFFLTIACLERGASLEHTTQSRDELVIEARRAFPDIQVLLALYKQLIQNPAAEPFVLNILRILYYYYAVFEYYLPIEFDGNIFFSNVSEFKTEHLMLASAMSLINHFTGSPSWFDRAIEAKAVDAAQRMLANWDVEDSFEWAEIACRDLSIASQLKDAVLQGKQGELIKPSRTEEIPLDASSSTDSDDESHYMLYHQFDFLQRKDTPPLAIAVELLSSINREQIRSLFSRQSIVLNPVPSNVSLVAFNKLLFVDYDISAWYSIIVSILHVEDLTQQEMHTLVDSNLIGLVVLGLSVAGSPSFKILCLFLQALEWCRVKERNQIHILLHPLMSMMALLEGGSTTIPSRMQCIFIAHCLPIVLEPGHLLYCPILDYCIKFRAQPITDQDQESQAGKRQRPPKELPQIPFLAEAFGIKTIPSLLKNEDIRRDVSFMLDVLLDAVPGEDLTLVESHKEYEALKDELQMLLVTDVTCNPKWKEMVIDKVKALLPRIDQDAVILDLKSLIEAQ